MQRVERVRLWCRYQISLSYDDLFILADISRRYWQCEADQKINEQALRALASWGLEGCKKLLRKYRENPDIFCDLASLKNIIDV